LDKNKIIAEVLAEVTDIPIVPDYIERKLWGFAIDACGKLWDKLHDPNQTDSVDDLEPEDFCE